MVRSPASVAVGSWLQLPMFIDVEASGMGRGSYPIEVGFVDESGRGTCSLIRPFADWTHWDEKAEQLHGITRTTLEHHGRPAVQVAMGLNRRLAGRTLYSDGWGMDQSWIGLLFERCELVPMFRLESLRTLLSEPQASAWGAAKDQVIAETGTQRHRASNDARVLQQTYLRVVGG